MAWISEAELETHFMASLAPLGYTLLHGADVSPEMKLPLRASFRDTILGSVLLDSLVRLNPEVPVTALEDAARRVADSVFVTDVVQENRRLHDLMVHGVPVTFLRDGEERNARVQLIDWTNATNDWRAVRQFDVAGRVARIPDVVLFLNGLPLVVVELKGVAGADVSTAWRQIDTYKSDIPDLFRTNLLTVISDGLHARYGSLSAGFDRYMNWRTVDGQTLVPKGSALELATLTSGLLAPQVLLDMLRWFVVFEDEGKGPIKKIAGYHQFHAVRKACDTILSARTGDGKGGVIWHTQGSGKSLLMTFLSGRVMHHPAMENPTLLVLTDRNDLDNQLFATFARCKDLLGEEPVQAENTEDLRRLLDRNVGGIVFSTIQKFRPEAGETFPELTSRSNVVVLVDEAHRTQYGFEAKLNKETGEIRHGLAYQLRRALPNAVYVAFTGTPVELVGADTRGVFGDYIDVYDIAQAVADGATVPIYYEARVARITLDEDVAATLDEEFDEATEMLAEDQANATARKWARVEALVGADRRVETVVQDILTHFDARLEAMDGKAMIVCMSRRICAEVYERIVSSRPDWHGDTDDTGRVKVVMTGSATDPASLRPHIRSKSRQEAIRGRFKDPADPLKVVIVRDMWLTGFDAPCMHTLYVDKPMKGHGLMQAIARVNRVFRDKPAGLVVDYIGVAAELKAALAHYSQTDQAQTGIDEAEAVAALLDALDVARVQFHGFDYSAALQGSPGERLAVLPGAIEHILAMDNGAGAGAKRFHDAVAALVRGYKLASGSPQSLEHAEEVAFFAAVRSSLVKLEVGDRRNAGDSDFAIQQLINSAVASTEVVDILEACGFDRPDISVLSEEFMLELQNMQHRNLAVEALKKLLNGEISARTRTNVVQKEAFSSRLEQAIARYHNRSVDALQVLQELIALAKDLRNEPPDGLNAAERAFYDALAQNESAVEIMSNEELRVIATELVTTVRNNSGVDWWKRENVRAKMRVAIKRILNRHGYPPDLASEAVKLVLRQAEALATAIA
ncbi:type I restriction endonuclease subunit R [Cereibacter changlensis]|uniref:Type I restriction enzyme endonuclease subunit n=1 Tax=Cereibacter changlensis TaxID=402884 RepID=A0A4U0Z0K9_9RHOB|nr:type I restriction endonuclease subunit R [Cereibacter changlensis]TKA97715.1 type I restriction endonuclease subunit R [Cereibacter changlensis]